MSKVNLKALDLHKISELAQMIIKQDAVSATYAHIEAIEIYMYQKGHDVPWMLEPKGYEDIRGVEEL